MYNVDGVMGSSVDSSNQLNTICPLFLSQYIKFYRIYSVFNSMQALLSA